MAPHLVLLHCIVGLRTVCEGKLPFRLPVQILAGYLAFTTGGWLVHKCTATQHSPDSLGTPLGWVSYSFGTLLRSGSRLQLRLAASQLPCTGFS